MHCLRIVCVVTLGTLSLHKVELLHLASVRAIRIFLLYSVYNITYSRSLAEARMLGLQVMERYLKKLVSNTEHDPMTFVYAVTLVTFSPHIVKSFCMMALCWSNQHLPLRPSSGTISWCRARALRRLRQWACML